VTFPAIRRVDEYRYDTARHVSYSADEDVRDPGDAQRAPEQDGRVHIVTEFEYDAAGNLRATRELGRVEPALPPDERDSPVTVLSLPESGSRCAADWNCLETGIRVVEGTPPNATTLREIRYTRDLVGDISRIEAYLGYPGLAMSNITLMRSTLGSSGPPSASTQAGWRTIQTFNRDVFGNILRMYGPAGAAQSCTEIDFDGPYRQFPQKFVAYKAGGCTGTPLTWLHTFDRGRQSVTLNTAPSGSVMKTVYDAFGRVQELHTPAPDTAPPATELAIKLTHVTKAPTPYVIVDRRVERDQFIRSIEIFNGIGEPVLGFDQADAVADGAPWVLRDWTQRDPDGRVHVTHRPWFFAGNPLTVADTAPPMVSAATAFTTTYDPFGRVVNETDDALQISAFRYTPLEIEFKDAEQLKSSGPYVGFFSTTRFDGHDRIREQVSRSEAGAATTVFDYRGTGEVTRIRRRLEGTPASEQYERTLSWDSFGRLVENREPNTSALRTINGVERFVTWLYVYDNAGRVVGTSDARGCGKDIYYDGLDRIIAEDYSPCLNTQPQYTAPNLITGDGTETYYVYDAYEPGQLSTAFPDRAANAVGALAAIRNRGAHSRFNYDARGRLRHESVRVAAPGPPATLIANRYTTNTFSRSLSYDLGDRIRQRDTGLRSDELLEGGQSFEAYTYTNRGLLRTMGGSYGLLLHELRYAPDESVRQFRVGDAASTLTQYGYDTRDRLSTLRMSRTAPALWTMPTPVYSMPSEDTTQLELVHHQFVYDDVSNPTSIADLSTSYWRAGARQRSRVMKYDGLYGLTRITYDHGSDEHVPPFHPEAIAGDRRPTPERQADRRMLSQQFKYDFLGNLATSEDNEHLRYDWSLGAMQYGRQTTGGTFGPNQLVAAEGIIGEYDDAGNLRELTVSRPSCSTVMPSCSHRFVYDWDEVGQLMRAKRWDYPAGLVPAANAAAAPDWTLDYSYSDGRVRTSFRNAAGEEQHTLDVFDTLRIDKAEFDAVSSRYQIGVDNEVGFVAGIGRVFVDRAGIMPQAAGRRRHVWLSLEDDLGSASFVLDKDSGEVVERAVYQPFGALESDYRPRRWGSGREPFKFTGKEEDIEVGLTYFGARYYQPHLGRWISPDPLTIHGVSGTLNPYAYADGRVMTDVDPIGLQQTPAGPPIITEEVTVRGTPRPHPIEHPQVGGTAGGEVPSPVLSAITKLPQTQINIAGGYHTTPVKVWKATINEAVDLADSLATAMPMTALARATGLTKAPPKVFANVSGGDDHELAEYQAKVAAIIASTAAGPRTGPRIPLRVRIAQWRLNAPFKMKFSALPPEKHHTIAMYLGGLFEQKLAPLSKEVHRAFHTGLRFIFPMGGKTASGAQISGAYYRNLSPATLKQIHRQLALYTAAFDAKYGTSLLEVMKENGILSMIK
jgi:RHS repeat-associated protein